jgi:WD40 repeat protein
MMAINCRCRQKHRAGCPPRGTDNRPYNTLASAGYAGVIHLWDTETGQCRQVLRPVGPYEGMKITGVTGITEAQRAALKSLGAVEP